jgi:hypothetical protein
MVLKSLSLQESDLRLWPIPDLITALIATDFIERPLSFKCSTLGNLTLSRNALFFFFRTISPSSLLAHI